MKRVLAYANGARLAVAAALAGFGAISAVLTQVGVSQDIIVKIAAVLGALGVAGDRAASVLSAGSPPPPAAK